MTYLYSPCRPCCEEPVVTGQFVQVMRTNRGQSLGLPFAGATGTVPWSFPERAVGQNPSRQFAGVTHSSGALFRNNDERTRDLSVNDFRFDIPDGATIIQARFYVLSSVLTYFSNLNFRQRAHFIGFSVLVDDSPVVNLPAGVSPALDPSESWLTINTDISGAEITRDQVVSSRFGFGIWGEGPEVLPGNGQFLLVNNVVARVEFEADVRHTCGMCNTSMPSTWEIDVSGVVNVPCGAFIPSTSNCASLFNKEHLATFRGGCVWQTSQTGIGALPCGYVHTAEPLFTLRKIFSDWHLIVAADLAKFQPIPASTFNCIGPNTFTRIDESEVCDWPASVTVRPA